MRSTVKWYLLLVIFSFTASAGAEPNVALFWHAASGQDTSLVENLAPRIASLYDSSNALLQPDLVHTHLSDLVFDNSDTARSLFTATYPHCTRIDISFQRFGNTATLSALRFTRLKVDTLRVFYPGANKDVIDWLEFQLTKWLFPVAVIPLVKLVKKNSVEVGGTPVGAEIMVDGEPTGERIPATLDKLSSGYHLVELVGEYIAARKINLLPNTSMGIELIGQPCHSLLEVRSDPPGLDVSIDGISSGATPFLRESIPGSYSVTIGGDNREEITRMIDLEAHQWRVLTLSPKLMNRVVIVTNPPGGVIYNGPVRVGIAGDTLPCPSEGATWTVDHPLASPVNLVVKGEPGKVVTLEVNLPPAIAYVRLKNWSWTSQLLMDDSLLKVFRADSQQVLAGRHTYTILTPGFRTRHYVYTIDRNTMTTVEARPVPSPSWLSISLSTIAPGFGQLYDGYRGRGSIMMMTAIITATGLVQADNELRKEISFAQDAEWNYRRSISTSSAISWAKVADGRWNSAREQLKKRDSWTVAVGAVWTISILDRILFPPNELKAGPVGSGMGIGVSIPMTGKKL